MDIDIENIEDLKNNDSALENTPLPEKKVDEHGRAYATGKRKNAVARVWLKPGSGIIKINGKISDDYFARPVLRMLINKTNAPIPNAIFTDIGTTPGAALSENPKYEINQGKLEAIHVPIR